MNNLHELCKKYNVDKLQHGYIDFYEPIFKKYIQSEIVFVEIGVLRGQSAFTWQDYFSNAHIFVIDIFDKKDLFDNSNINFIHIDAASLNSSHQIIDIIQDKCGKTNIDILIDDGSHFQHDQMKSFGELFTYISNGGYYIIEDICREENLRNGSEWWGHSLERQHKWTGWGGYTMTTSNLIREDKVWLAGNDIDYMASSDATIKNFISTSVFNSKYLTNQQNKYITDNVGELQYLSDELSCQSKLAIFKKR